MVMIFKNLNIKDEASKMRLNQYNDIEAGLSLGSQIVKHGWCGVFAKVLVFPDADITQDHVETEDDLLFGIEHDTIEKILGMYFLEIYQKGLSTNTFIRSIQTTLYIHMTVQLFLTVAELFRNTVQ